MYYKTRRGCKVVPIEPFVIMSGHDSSSGLTRFDTDALLLNRHGLDSHFGGRQSDRQITPCSDLVVVHNFTGQELVKVDPAGIRSTIPAEAMYYQRHNHIFSNHGGLLDDTKLKLEIQCTSAKRSLNDQAVIIKLTSVIGCNVEQVRARVNLLGFPQAVKDTILACSPNGMKVGNTFSFVYEFMLVYLVHASVFDTSHTVVEPQTQVCLSRLKFEDAYGHPLDMREGVSDVSAMENPLAKDQPLYLNAEIVYHHHPFQPRFINTNGRVTVVPQILDTTRDEGFHLTTFRMMENGKGMGYHHHHAPVKHLTEEFGFYKSEELAKNRKTTEQADKANEELANTTSHLKSLKAEAVKDLNSNTRAAYDKMLQLTERSFDDSRSYVQKKLEQDSEALTQAFKTIDKLQEELRDNKRDHEAAMQSRKEFLETIRLVPPLLGVVAAVMAIRKKNQQ